MVRIKKCMFFFGPKNPDFGPKIRFFVWDPVFCQRGVRNPRRWLRFGTNVSSLRLFVPELRPFSWGEPGRRSKKSSPTPLWGHRLPVTALALSACGLDNEYDEHYYKWPALDLCHPPSIRILPAVYTILLVHTRYTFSYICKPLPRFRSDPQQIHKPRDVGGNLDLEYVWLFIVAILHFQRAPLHTFLRN